MSQLFNAINTRNARTTNGMATHSTTSDYCVDLFGAIGSLRGRSEAEIVRAFGRAFGQEPLTAMKILFYSRNILGGQGERNTFKVIIKHLATNYNESFKKNIAFVPSFGRWDDLLALVGTPFEDDAFGLIQQALETRNALCAKWMPRPNGSAKNKAIANKLRKFMGLTPKQYRLVLTTSTQVVESQMCAKEFGAINYSHVPSVAANKYRKAFWKRDAERYKAYLDALEKGTDPKVKVNAKAIFPHDIVKGYMGYNSGKDSLLESQWKALPDFMAESEGERLLPVCDVSGSMTCMGGLPMLVSLTMGIYISERNKGIFKDGFLTFHSNPSLMYLKGTTLRDKVNELSRAPWGGSTNLTATFDLILNKAVQNQVPANEMPTKIVIISDMEFNQACYGQTAMDMIKAKYAQAGYTMPTIIFWNVNAREGNNPVKFNENGTALVSGFSPSILKSILAGGKDLTPRGMMMKTLSDPAYDVITA